MPRKIIDPKIDSYIKEHYPRDLVTEIAKVVGYSPPWVRNRAKQLNVEHTDAYYIALLHYKTIHLSIKKRKE